jgi:hypothetical protein
VTTARPVNPGAYRLVRPKAVWTGSTMSFIDHDQMVQTFALVRLRCAAAQQETGSPLRRLKIDIRPDREKPWASGELAARGRLLSHR